MACSRCRGSGEEPDVILNPFWPQGEESYSEKSGEPCIGCDGTSDMTILGMMRIVYEAHAPHGRCGCKVCRAWACSKGDGDEKGAWAEVVATAMIGADFSWDPGEWEEHDGIPQTDLVHCVYTTEGGHSSRVF